MNAAPLPIDVDRTGPTGGVATLRLVQEGKPVVVLDLELIQRLEATLRGLPRDVIGLVMASGSERVFVAGADLNAITELSDDALATYLAYGQRVFGMLLDLPFPTAAAINGAALGGGLELAMHCDALIGAPPPVREGQPGKPYPVGLPEAGLCICPGWGGTNLLAARMDPVRAIRMTCTGQTMLFDEACAAGLFDVVAPSAGELLATAKAWIMRARQGGRPERDGAPLRWIGRGGRASGTLRALDQIRDSGDLTSEQAKAVLDAIDIGLARGWRAALETEQQRLVHLRGLAPAKQAIEAFFAKSRK